jgi:hypothetical protein
MLKALAEAKEKNVKHTRVTRQDKTGQERTREESQEHPNKDVAPHQYKKQPLIRMDK